MWGTLTSGRSQRCSFKQEAFRKISLPAPGNLTEARSCVQMALVLPSHNIAKLGDVYLTPSTGDHRTLACPRLPPPLTASAQPPVLPSPAPSGFSSNCRPSFSPASLAGRGLSAGKLVLRPPPLCHPPPWAPHPWPGFKCQLQADTSPILIFRSDLALTARSVSPRGGLTGTSFLTPALPVPSIR